MTAIVVFDYGVGNVHSVCRMAEAAGGTVDLTDDVDAIMNADGLIVPGVGDFDAVVTALKRHDGHHLITRRIDAGKPVLGICVGLQIMFEGSDERGSTATGLGIVPGRITRLTSPIIPHMGWSRVTNEDDLPILSGLDDHYFYFAHSYAATDAARLKDYGAGVAMADAGQPFVAALTNGPLSATQFHPEKSGAAGKQLMTNWITNL